MTRLRKTIGVLPAVQGGQVYPSGKEGASLWLWLCYNYKESQAWSTHQLSRLHLWKSAWLEGPPWPARKERKYDVSGGEAKSCWLSLIIVLSECGPQPTNSAVHKSPQFSLQTRNCCPFWLAVVLLLPS